MRDDVRRPERQMVVVVTLKFNMEASSASSGEIVKVRSVWPILKLKQIEQTATRRPSHIRTHESITNYLITARDGITVKFQTSGWNFCFMDRASGRGP